MVDDAFPLRQFNETIPTKNLGGAQRVFNNHLSRARRVVENPFGILANVFRIFRKKQQPLSKLVAFYTITFSQRKHLGRFIPRMVYSTGKTMMEFSRRLGAANQADF